MIIILEFEVPIFVWGMFVQYSRIQGSVFLHDFIAVYTTINQWHIGPLAKQNWHSYFELFYTKQLLK